MKKTVGLILLFLACSLLPAQNEQRLSFFIPDVTGSGNEAGDNAFLHHMTVTEVQAQDFRIMSTHWNADYSLTGIIRPAGGKTKYAFFLTLRDNKTGTDIVEQHIAYNTADEVIQFFPLMMFNFFSNIPRGEGPATVSSSQESADSKAGTEAAVQPEKPAQPPVMTWHFGGCLAWSPRSYIGEHEMMYPGNFSAALMADWNFYRFLALAMGLELANDWVNTVDREYRDLILEIPVALKGIIRFKNAMSLEPYLGIHANITLTGVTRPSLLSLMAGLQYGMSLGPGIVFIDCRLSTDAFDSKLETMDTYRRGILRLGVGYKMGFFPRRK